MMFDNSLEREEVLCKWALGLPTSPEIVSRIAKCAVGCR